MRLICDSSKEFSKKTCGHSTKINGNEYIRLVDKKTYTYMREN